jgi:hypothetical protein
LHDEAVVQAVQAVPFFYTLGTTSSGGIPNGAPQRMPLVTRTPNT